MEKNEINQTREVLYLSWTGGVALDIDRKTADHIRGVCKQIGLSSETTEKIILFLAGFTNIVARGNGNVPASTNQERRKDLKRFIALSSELADFLESMPAVDLITSRMLGKKVIQSLPEYQYLNLNTPMSTTINFDIELKMLAIGATQQLDRIPSGEKGGRRRVLEPSARKVEEIWEIVQCSDISPGRGGDFEYLCDELFQAGGVHAKAEGAVRYFVKHLLHKPKNKVIALTDSKSKTELVEKTTTKKNRKNP